MLTIKKTDGSSLHGSSHRQILAAVGCSPGETRNEVGILSDFDFIDVYCHMLLQLYSLCYTSHGKIAKNSVRSRWLRKQSGL